MKIICAGFPKTGTKSMAMALRDLGYTVHDFEEHVDINLDRYINFMDGKTDSAPLMSQYVDVDAVVDQPACTMWRTFLNHYPDAVVILMERENPEAWLDSFVRMLKYGKDNYKVWYEDYMHLLSPTRAKLDALNRHNMARTTGLGLNYWQDMNISSENWMNMYITHNAAVKQLVPKEQLLVVKVGEGWENLCRFLDKPVPDYPFPRENVGGAKGNIIEKLYEDGIFKRVNQEFKQNLLVLGIGMAAASLSILNYVRR